MSQSRSKKSAEVKAVGRRLVQAAAEVNPLVGLATALAVPLLRLFCRRKPAALAICRMKVDTYTQTTVRGGQNRQEGSKKDPRGFQEGSSTAFAAGATKGGSRHG